MSDEFDSVSVWVGFFLSEQVLDAYFEEKYDASESEPISLFAADQQQLSYDHDFFERSFREPTADPVALLTGHSFSASYGTAVASAFKQRGVETSNTIVLVWNHEIARPRSVEGIDYSLFFLGTFACNPSADTLRTTTLGITRRPGTPPSEGGMTPNPSLQRTPHG